MQPQPQPPLDEFVDGVLASAQFAQLNRYRQFDVARGALGVHHIIPKKRFTDGRLVRDAGTSLCRGVPVAETGLSDRLGMAPTCRRCQQMAERIILRRKSRSQK